MKAMILEEITQLEKNPEPLKLVEIPRPEPGQGEILLKVLACGVCHTELDEIEGRTPPSTFPRVLGHEIVGRVEKLGSRVGNLQIGDRVGVAWFYSGCGKCEFCQRGNENLCPEFQATGRDADGGYAEFMNVPADSTYPIPGVFSDLEAAPLLCAGVVGYRALKLTGLKDDEVIGLFGFGASAHIIIQVVKYKFPHSRVYVFTRPNQLKHQNLAKKLGADWVGATGDLPPEKLHRAIDFTPAWNPVVQALRNLRPGGRLVINAIRKESRDKETVINLDYSTDLWYEKELKSTANVTRVDAAEFLSLAGEIPIKPEIQVFDLKDANRALVLLKQGKIQGAGVLKI